MANMLRGILFDYSGTILLSDGFSLEAGLREMCSHLTLPSGTTADDFFSFAVELEQEFQTIRNQTQFEFSFDKFIRIVIDYFGIKTEKSLSELESIYYNSAVSYHLAPGIQKFLCEVKDAGIRAGVVSNSTNAGFLLESQIARNGLLDLFEFVISSADYGIRKQHHLLYDIALSKLGIARNQVIFIGDNLEYDIVTAQNAGISAAWYNQKRLPQIDTIIPDYVFSSWDSIDWSALVPVR